MIKYVKQKVKIFLFKYFPEFGLKLFFKRVTGKKLNLQNPKTFSEKIQWLKLYDYPNNELVIECADKYRMHDYLKRKGLSQYSVKILGCWEEFNDINWETLPDKFVLKMNHGCNFNIFIEDKNSIDHVAIKNTLEKWSNIDYGLASLETQYSKIKPLIIAEEFLQLDKKKLEYNFYCLNGIPRYCRVMVYEDVEQKISKGTCYSLPDWKKLDFNYPEYELKNEVPIPSKLNDMLHACNVISKDFKLVRVDFLQLDNGEVILGELTFTPASGMSKNLTDTALNTIGSWLQL